MQKRKRDYSKYKQICLLCAKSEKLTVKNSSVLSQGGDYQVRRHRNSNHTALTLKDMKKHILPINQISVPQHARELATKKCHLKVQPEMQQKKSMTRLVRFLFTEKTTILLQCQSYLMMNHHKSKVIRT